MGRKKIEHAANTKIFVPIDSETKEKAQVILDEIGMDISTAIKIFLKKVINSGSMPFILHSHSVELKNMEQRKIDQQNRMKRGLHKLK